MPAMPTRDFRFIHLDDVDVRELASTRDLDKRRAVRSHAMKHYRARQSAQRQSKPCPDACTQVVPAKPPHPVPDMRLALLAPGNAAVHRQGLVHAFTNGIPWVRESRSGHRIASSLTRWLSPQEPLAVMAHNALLLAHLASTTGDANLAIEASQQHVKALQCLRHALASPAAIKTNAFLCAVDALGVCEMFQELSQSQNAWRHHANALGLLLSARGPAALDYQHPLTRSLVFNAVHLNLMDALSSRTSFVFGRRSWLRHLEDNCKGRQWCIVHISCRLPALLERLDAGKALVVSSSETGKLYKDLAALDLQLAGWLQAWYLEDINVRPTIVSIEEFPAFLALHRSVSNAFPRVLKFDSLEAALGHVSFWLMRLPLLEASCNLLARTENKSLVFSALRSAIALELEQCANSICQSAPALLGASPETSIGVQTMKGVFLWALAWYTKNMCQEKMKFCRALLHMDTSAAENIARGVVTHDRRTVVANAFVARRMLWLESVGPSVCYMKCETI